LQHLECKTQIDEEGGDTRVEGGSVVQWGEWGPEDCKWINQHTSLANLVTRREAGTDQTPIECMHASQFSDSLTSSYSLGCEWSAHIVLPCS